MKDQVLELIGRRYTSLCEVISIVSSKCKILVPRSKTFPQRIYPTHSLTEAASLQYNISLIMKRIQDIDSALDYKY